MAEVVVTVPEHRYCEYRKCGACIDEMRPNAKFCHPGHKARENHLRRLDPPGTTYPVGKPYENVHARRRRPSREGLGTHIYLVRDEIEVVRGLLAGRPAGSELARDRLARKVPVALGRIDRRAA